MLTITCAHCGPIRVEDAIEARYVRGLVSALAAGHAPLGAITCPLCRDEVRARDVRPDVDAWLAGGREERMIENVKCPQCQGPMTSRKNNATGQRFWGCNAYPKCKGTRDTDGEAPRQRWDREDLQAEQSPSERLRENDRARWRHS